ncbi:PASTA domain-containing protein [Vagococcus carniphilus]|uniref:PASTA domain-containing protein n=1 Tax=Vagococcus carniphilus TaxID=218144 RepID=UPI003BA96B74
MSDFLSNFSNDNYKDTMSKKKKVTENKKEPEVKKEPQVEKTELSEVEPTLKKRKRKRKYVSQEQFEAREEERFDNPQLVETHIDQSLEDILTSTPITETRLNTENSPSDELHEIEIDPEYQKKQRTKKIVIGVTSAIVLLVGYFIYYNSTHVKMPNFDGKTIVDVRKWANENRMEVDAKPSFSLKEATNNIMKQEVASGKNVKKGSTLKFTVSEGPDPEEVIKLPDFKKLSQGESEQFIEKNKAENLNLITEYSDKVEKGKFIRIEFNDKEVTADIYRRRDLANVYYSKGKEVFEKNISVPNFSGKTKSDVQEWADKNSISVKYEDEDSEKIEEGKVISQSIEKNKKLAKHDKMSVKISVGKAIIVPNYGDYSVETAGAAVEGMEASVQQLFSDSVPFGKIISQSVPAGTKLTGKDSKAVKLVYSAGQPYIKSYFGQLEGDLPKLIYEDFNSKGANITYDIYYIDSDQEKGTIVKMSVYNQYIPSNAYLTFGISNGANADQPGKVERGKSED